MKPPLTSKKLGSTRCPLCEKQFSTQPERRIVERPATDYAGGRPFYSASRPVTVLRRWHVDCYERFEADNEALRAQCRQDQQILCNSLAAEAGLPLPFPELGSIAP